MRAILLAVAVSLCAPVASTRTTGQGAFAGIAAAIRDDVEGRAAVGALTRAEQAELRALYQPDGYQPLWLDATGTRVGRDAREALSLVDRTADDGLDPGEYLQGELVRLRPALDAQSPLSPPVLARVDVALSLGMLRYLRHLHAGRVDPRKIGFRLNRPLAQQDIVASLRAAIANHRIAETVANARPRFAQYRSLSRELVRYRALAVDRTLAPLVPPPKVSVHPGDSYPGIRILYDRLMAFGDLQPATPPPVGSTYELPLVEGLKRFQARHGLDPDGILGAGTLAALRTPLSWRVRQIALALERLRWLPALDDERVIVVNIPMFRLWAWDSMPPDGAPSFATGVIVGRAVSTQTPVFVEEMREVIFRPYWNVPRSILRHDLLPKLERDPGYLRRQNMEIVGSGDRAPSADLTAESLAGLREGTLRVRQRPGPDNALGLIKFVFPNESNIYMHGTPAQELFARSRRDFSHGCVRVEDPVTLAEWTLQDRPEWNRDRILAAAAGSQSVHVKLERPIRVILFYTTAAVMPEDGMVHFAEDIYGHDARLDRALTSRGTDD